MGRKPREDLGAMGRKGTESWKAGLGRFALILGCACRTDNLKSLGGYLSAVAVELLMDQETCFSYYQTKKIANSKCL